MATVKSFLPVDEERIDILTKRGFIHDVYFRMKKVEVTAQGAQLSYFFLLSFFPLLIFAVQLLPYLNLQQDAVFRFLHDIMPLEVYVLIEGTLAEILNNRNGSLLSIGVLGTIWSASNGIDALFSAINRAYDTERRSGFMDRILSLAFTFILVIVVLVVLLLPIFGQQIVLFLFANTMIENDLIQLVNDIRWTMPPFIIFIVLIALYWLIPNTMPKLKITSVLPGTIFTTACWALLTSVFSIYINNFSNYSATYGSIGGVIVFMLWLYFTGILLILGAILNATMQKYMMEKNKKQNELFQK